MAAELVDQLEISFGGRENLSRFLVENTEVVIINIVSQPQPLTLPDLQTMLHRYWIWDPTHWQVFRSGTQRINTNEPNVYVYTAVTTTQSNCHLIIVFGEDIANLNRNITGTQNLDVSRLDRTIREIVVRRMANEPSTPRRGSAQVDIRYFPILLDSEAQDVYTHLHVNITLIKLLILQYLSVLPSNMLFPRNISDVLHQDRNIVVVGLDWRMAGHFGDLFIGTTPRIGTYTHVAGHSQPGVVVTIDGLLAHPDTYDNILQNRSVIYPTNPDHDSSTIHTSHHNSFSPPSTDIQDLAQALLTTRTSDPTDEMRERDREIKLLQQCLLELEIEYFRVVAENDMFHQQQQADEEAFIEPWYRHNNTLDARNREFQASERDNATRMRQFQDQVAIKGFGSALDAQNNALSAVAGVAVNQRPYTDSARFESAIQHQSKRPSTENIEDSIKRLRRDTDVHLNPTFQFG